MQGSRFARHAPGLTLVAAALLLIALPSPAAAAEDPWAGAAAPDPGASWHGRPIRAPHPRQAGSRLIADLGVERPSASPLHVGAGAGSQCGSTRVRDVQRRLRDVGYHPGPVTGVFNRRTRDAVRWMQYKHGLEPNGVVAAATIALLQARADLPRLVVGLGAGTRAKCGSARVRSVQRRLIEHGYDPGPVNGRFGRRTRVAVVFFQQDHGLTPNGKVEPETTLVSLRMAPSSFPVAANEPETPVPSVPNTVSTPAPAPAEPPSNRVMVGIVIGLIALIAAIAFLPVPHRRRDRPTTAGPQPRPPEPSAPAVPPQVPPEPAPTPAGHAPEADAEPETATMPAVATDRARPRTNALRSAYRRARGGELIRRVQAGGAAHGALRRIRALRPDGPAEPRSAGDGAAPRDGAVTNGRSPTPKEALRDRIQQMRAAGLTLDAIAEAFEREEVPKPPGAREWRPSTVQRVLGRRRPREGRGFADVDPSRPFDSRQREEVPR